MAPLHWNLSTLCTLDLGLGPLNTHKYYLLNMKMKAGSRQRRRHKSKISISYIKINVYSVLLAALGDIQHFQKVN